MYKTKGKRKGFKPPRMIRDNAEPLNKKRKLNKSSKRIKTNHNWINSDRVITSRRKIGNQKFKPPKIINSGMATNMYLL